MSVFDTMDKQIGDFFETLPETKTRKPRPVNKKSIRQATIAVLNTYPHGKIFEAENELNRTGLKYEVGQYLWDQFGINKFPHVDTCKRYLREENDPVVKYACINKGKSFYEVVR